MFNKILKIEDEGIYYIGGIVRDELLGIDCFDVDITYVGNAINFAKKHNLDIIKINEPFGTVKVRIDNNEVDIASTRNEIYPKKGHLPKITEIGCSLEKDVGRRDFTINTLAKSIKTGTIVDHLGGVEDINNKLIRILHKNSFIDDPTRIIRALKFSVRFGFRLENETKKLQDNYLNNINYDMSCKRIKKELIETFNLNSQKAFEQFFRQNIYKLISKKEVNPPKYNIEKLINKYPIKDIWLVYLGWMDLSMIPLTKREKKIINDYHSIKNVRSDNDFTIYNIFKNCETESILLYAINIDENTAIKYLDKLSKIKISITGENLQEIGIKPSIKYSKCFEYILKEKLKNPNMTKSDEITLAKEFFEV